MGPCDIHRRHSNTVGPDGSIYACPGFTGERTSAIGHISDALEESHRRSAADFESLAAWKSCGDCAFIPVCAGGCSVASQSEQGDKHKPTCHKDSMEAALVTFAHDAAAQMMEKPGQEAIGVGTAVEWTPTSACVSRLAVEDRGRRRHIFSRHTRQSPIGERGRKGSNRLLATCIRPVVCRDRDDVLPE